MFLVNSRLGLFSAACSHRLPFSRSYGVILPSSLTTVLSLALGFSPHLPVSVCGTGTFVSLEAFPDSLNESTSLLDSLPITDHNCKDGFACLYSLSAWTCSSIRTLRSSSCVPPSINQLRRYGILNPLSITYAFRPWLRSRLTLSGRTFLRNP